MLYILLLLLLPSLVVASCSTSCFPGFFGCNCQQCSNCPVAYPYAGGCTGSVTCPNQAGCCLPIYDCFDGPLGNGKCFSCKANQYSASCTPCLNSGVFNDPTYPYLWDGGLFCDLEYQGTTCGGIAQTTFCRCLDTTKTFVLPKPPPHIVDNFADNYATWRGLTLYGGPDGTTNLGLIANPYPTPDPLQYCCIPTCNPRFTGCQCDLDCGVGCANCTNNATAVFTPGSSCPWNSIFPALRNLTLLTPSFTNQPFIISANNVAVLSLNSINSGVFLSLTDYQAAQVVLAAAIAMIKTFRITKTSTPNSLGNDMLLEPGVYKFNGPVTLSGLLTFTGGGLFILIIPSTLTVASNSGINLANGARACDVVWQVDGLVTFTSPFGSTVPFVGAVLNSAGITIPASPSGTTAFDNVITGRLLSQGAVTILGQQGPAIPTIVHAFTQDCSGGPCVETCPLIYCPNFSSLTCHGCDNKKYMVNGTCLTCPTGCASSSGPTCDSNGLCLNECPPGFWGPQCAGQCPQCDAAAHCQQGRNGTGQCICNDLTFTHLNTTKSCIFATCGTDRSNLCNGQTCVSSQFGEFCVCDNAHTGTTCETLNTALDTCDCGVIWADPVAVLRASLATISLVVDLAGVSLFGSLPIAIGSKVQAEYLCYQDFTCDGFLTWDVGSVLTAAFFSNGGSSVPSGLPTDTTFSMYRIDRISQNNCSSASLDAANYYYDKFKTYVDSYAADVQSNQPGPTPTLSGALMVGQVAVDQDEFTSVPGFSGNYYWATRHFRYVGHQYRLSPNAVCPLLPVVFQPESFCHKARCLSVTGTGPPCISGDGARTGYCESNSAAADNSGFQCKCLEFHTNGFTGYPGSLQWEPAFMGLACQFEIWPFCLFPGDSVLCHGVVNGCQARSEWNGNFYLENIQSYGSGLNTSDFIPFCNCAGSQYKDQFCQNSVCSSCPPLRGSCPNPLVCECNYQYVGDSCQYPATPCLTGSSFLNVQCSGFGTCYPPTGSQTQPSCNCTTDPAGVPYTGSACQNYPCNSATMVFGHGTCVNGHVTGCYPPYTGSACETDNCTPYGGTVISNPLPSGCRCSPPFSNLLGGIVAVPSSCWPQCPIYNNQTVCGVRGAGVCNQAQLDGTNRVAFCECSTGYFLNTTTGLCDLYCVNGAIQQGGTCLCNAGFDTNHGLNPRCDHPVCNDQGTFNFTKSSCDCVPPYNSFTNCATSVCSIGVPGASVIPWLGGPAPFKCKCPLPYLPLNPSAPYDCAGSVCAPNGRISDVYVAGVSPASSACVCFGQYRTLCSTLSPSCLNYCNASYCLNGGAPNPTNSLLCSCLAPYAGAQCQSSTCNATNTASIDVVNGVCVCIFGYGGPTCSLTTTQVAAGIPPQQPPAQISTTPTTSTSTALSTAAIGGIAVGAVVGVVGIAVLIYFTLIKGTPTLLGTVKETKPLIGIRR